MSEKDYSQMNYNELINERDKFGYQPTPLLTDLAPCGKCKAKTGQACKTSSGKAREYYHNGRITTHEYQQKCADKQKQYNMLNKLVIQKHAEMEQENLEKEKQKKLEKQEKDRAEAEKEKEEVCALVVAGMKQSITVGMSDFFILETNNIIVPKKYTRLHYETLQALSTLGVEIKTLYIPGYFSAYGYGSKYYGV